MSSETDEPGLMIAVPSPSPSGISPAGLLRNRSSSCSSDIFKNWAGSVMVVVVGGISRVLVKQRDLKCLEEFDQSLFVGVGQIGAEVMSFVLNEIGTVVYGQ